MKTKNKLLLSLKKQVPSYAFILPGFLFVALYMGYPSFRSLYLSFIQYNFSFDPQPIFIGFNNYIKVFSNSYFMDALRNTVVLTIAFLPGVMIVSLILAMMSDRGVKGSDLFRACIFLPIVVPLSLTSITFQWILNEQYGLSNWFLVDVLHRSAWAQNWLGDGNWAMVSIIVVSLWKGIGVLVILFMAGLQAISNDIIEVARVSGTSTYQRIVHITLPNLKESYVICNIWVIIQAVKASGQPFIMTQGGPGTATLVLYQYTWINVFKYFEMGYASSIAYFTGVVILLLSVFNMFLNRGGDAKIKRVKV